MDTAIAIVGIGCRFAGCASLKAYWDVIMEQRSMFSVPGSDAEIPFGQSNLFARPYPVRLGQLGELYACVPSMQNFPRQVNAGENQDLYFATQLAFDALVDASIRLHSREPIRGTVRLGYAPPFNASTINWLQHTFFLDQTIEIVRRFMPNAPEASLEEMKAKLKESLQAYTDEQGEMELQDQLLRQAAATLDYTVTEAELEREMDEQLRAMEAQLGQQGLNLDMYCSFMNTTREALREESRAAAEANLKNQAAIDRIVMLEGIEPTEQEMGEAIAMICRQNGLTAEQLKPYYTAEFEKAVIRSVLASKVMGLIRDAADITVV